MNSCPVSTVRFRRNKLFPEKGFYPCLNQIRVKLKASRSVKPYPILCSWKISGTFIRYKLEEPSVKPLDKDYTEDLGTAKSGDL